MRSSRNARRIALVLVAVTMVLAAMAFAQDGQTVEFPGTTNPGETVVKTWWLALDDSATGTGVSIPDLADASIQAIGTFGGVTVTIEGSNDCTVSRTQIGGRDVYQCTGGTWATLSATAGGDLSFTAAGIKGPMENTLGIRPSTSGGDMTTDIDVYLVSRGNR